MSPNENALSEERFSIIEPYVKKEKTLKEISKENNISYSTLKRWASAYKKSGLDGLKRNSRKDKNTYRSISPEAMSYIKKIYNKNPNSKIFDLYKSLTDFLKRIGEKKISYDTIYRVINHLDPYVKSYANSNLESIKYPNELFEVEYFQLSYEILDESDDVTKKPYLYIVYDSYSKAIYSHILTFEKLSDEYVFNLLRDSILNNGYNEGEKCLRPSEVIFHNHRFKDKNLVDNIKEITGINIISSLDRDNSLAEFFYQLNNHYLNDLSLTLDLDFTYDSISSFIFRYINRIHNNGKKRKLNSRSENKYIHIRDLDFLLSRYNSNRKIQNKAIRIRNLLYTSDDLNDYNGYEVEILFSMTNISYVVIYHNDEYIGTAISDVFIDNNLNLQEFLSVKRALKIKFLNKSLTVSKFSDEFKKYIAFRKVNLINEKYF